MHDAFLAWLFQNGEKDYVCLIDRKATKMQYACFHIIIRSSCSLLWNTYLWVIGTTASNTDGAYGRCPGDYGKEAHCTVDNDGCQPLLIRNSEATIF